MRNVFHELVDYLDGVGPVRSAELGEKGIVTVADFIADLMTRHNLGERLNAVDSKLFGVCQLLLIEGIDKDIADALVAADVSVRRLDNLKAETILEKLEAQQQAGRVSSLPDVDEVKRWALQAARTSVCPIVALSVQYLGEGKPNGSLSVKTAKGTGEATAGGTYIISGIPIWDLVAKLYSDGRFLDFLDLRPHADQYAVVHRGYTSFSATDSIYLSSAGGSVSVPANGRVEFEHVDLQSFESGAQFTARPLIDGVLLVSDRYRLAGSSAVLTIVKTDSVTLPDGYAAGNRYFWQDGRLDEME